MSIVLSDDITLSMMRNGIDGKDGKDGINGKDGEAGKSAYQIWLDAGNTGSEKDYLESLKGANGQDGAPGKDGENGEDGADGENAVIYTLETDNPARRYAVASKNEGSSKIDTVTYTISPETLKVSFYRITGNTKEAWDPGSVTVRYSTREKSRELTIPEYASGKIINLTLQGIYEDLIIPVLKEITKSSSVDIDINGLISFYATINNQKTLIGSFEIKDAQPDEALKYLITSANIQASIDNNKMVFDTNGLTLYNGAFKIARATISNGQISSPTDLFYYDTTNTSLYINTSYARIGGWCIGGTGYDNTSLYSADKSIWLSPTGIAITTSVAGADTGTSLVFKAGNKFGVDTSGNLYASGASLTGKVNATSGSIGSGTKKWKIGSSTDDSYIYTGISSIDPTKDAKDTGEGIYIGTDGIRMRTKVGTSYYQSLIIQNGQILFTDINKKLYNALSTTYQGGMWIELGNTNSTLVIRGNQIAINLPATEDYIHLEEDYFYSSSLTNLGQSSNRWNGIYGTILNISSTSTFTGLLNANGGIEIKKSNAVKALITSDGVATFEGKLSAKGSISTTIISATGTVSAGSFSTTGEVGSGSVDTGAIYTNTITAAGAAIFNGSITSRGGISLTLSTTPSNQSSIPAITWQTFNDHTPYFGYDNATQVDGTFVWSLDGGDYMTGLAIGGGTGNLLWKGKMVATTDMIPSIPTSLKNPYSLIVKGNGTQSFVYDGSAGKTLNIKQGTNVTISSNTSGEITISSSYVNTTYSAGTGISLSGTTFSNSGVRSISTGSTNGTISVNTGGSSAEVAVKNCAVLGNGDNGIREIEKAELTAVSGNEHTSVLSGNMSCYYSNLGLVIIEATYAVTLNKTANSSYFTIGTVSGHKPDTELGLSVSYGTGVADRVYKARLTQDGDIQISVPIAVSGITQYLAIGGVFVDKDMDWYG